MKLTTMTPRQRLLAVYRGQTPDRVPALADLSYWHAAHGGGKFIPGRTDGANSKKIPRLLEFHRHTSAAIHLNLGTFYDEHYDGTVCVRSGVDPSSLRNTLGQRRGSPPLVGDDIQLAHHPAHGQGGGRLAGDPVRVRTRYLHHSVGHFL